MTSPALSCVDLSGGYSGVPTVRNLNLSVAPGEILAFLGPNGAGKTTTLLTLAGLLSPIGGTVTLFGSAIHGARPHQISRLGLALVPEDRALFPTLTTIENIKMGVRRGRASSVDDMLDLFPALAKRADVRAAMLSGGEQQMLVMARALVGEPAVLLVDEMSTGLAPKVVEQLLSIIRDLTNRRGTAVILVEQHVGLALSIADRAQVLVHGETVLEGTARDVVADPDRLERAYLGLAESGVARAEM